MSVSTQSTTDFYPTSEINVAGLSHFGIIEITGEQAKAFINGQVTADIISMTDEEWRWGAHCDPKGKMIASFRIFVLGERLFMLMPKSTLELDLAQLKKYAVFSKAELTDVSANWTILGLWGEKSVALLTQHFGELTQGLTATEQGVILKDNFGFMVILPHEQANNFTQQAKLELVDHKAWQALEINAGYPNIDSQHSGQYVPQMCNLQAIHGISFTKGCYMGQETIARMKYRGGNKRALYILEGTTQLTLSTESQVEIQLEGGYRKVGNVIEVVQQGEKVLMTAVLANDTEADAVLRIAEDESSHLQIKPLPYSLTEE
jgi:tRNA-modifying protein YgfZ